MMEGGRRMDVQFVLVLIISSTGKNSATEKCIIEEEDYRTGWMDRPEHRSDLIKCHSCSRLKERNFDMD